MSKPTNLDRTKLTKKWREEIERLETEVAQLRKAHAVLFDYGGWFTLGVGTEHPLKLFTCSEDGTHCIASVGAGDIMLIGRKREASP